MKRLAFAIVASSFFLAGYACNSVQAKGTTVLTCTTPITYTQMIQMDANGTQQGVMNVVTVPSSATVANGTTTLTLTCH